MPRLQLLATLPRGIAEAVRWYLRYGAAYRDVDELLSEPVSKSIT